MTGSPRRRTHRPRPRTTAHGPRKRTPPRKYVRHDERHRQILDVAAELFARQGFAGTTTRQIAAAGGTTETVLFRHFPTKESLYAAILEHRVPSAQVARWLDDLDAIAARQDDRALFGAVVRAMLDSFRTDTVYHRLMLHATLEGHNLARLAHSNYSGPVLGFLRDYVARRKAQGAFTRMRPEWVIHVLVASVSHFAQWKGLGINPLGLTEREVASQTAALMARLARSG
jgi:TetR/AcrR family transcriptional regulator